VDDHELLDVGGGARLDRFGDRTVDRPYPAAVGSRQAPEAWSGADLRYDRDGGWSGGAGGPADLEPWLVRLAGLTLELRATDAGQVGLFPEHALRLPWLADQVAARAATAEGDDRPRVLHLFAYTGLVTLALARAGAAVAHVDASRPSVAWARVNAAHSGLADRPIRWLVDDARGFAAREVRRERRYDGVVLDPPSYGHGEARGSTWRLEDDLMPLLGTCRALVRDDGFVLLTAHVEGLTPDDLGRSLVDAWGDRARAATTGELALPVTSGGRQAFGAFAQLDLAA
jgi:23S rRNA (cytosine1962-C5)-methyltransferase